MTLLELLQKVNEENERNSQNEKMKESLRKKVEETKKKRAAQVKSRLKNDEIDTTSYMILNKKSRRSVDFALQEIEKICAVETKYSEMLARLKDSGAFISNKMMCNLLKTKTGYDWTFKVVGNSRVAYLVFGNKLGERIRAQAAYLSDGKTFESAKKQLENINWFDQYINATRYGKSNFIMEFSLITGQKGFLFPFQIQSALESFFKHVQIDPQHPENLTFEDRRFEETKDFKPHNLYYRFQRDKKAGKFENPDGKSGK